MTLSDSFTIYYCYRLCVIIQMRLFWVIFGSQIYSNDLVNDRLWTQQSRTQR